MRRTTVSLPDALSQRIFNMRKDDRFTRCSYSELIRMLAEKGLEMVEMDQQPTAPAAPNAGQNST